ncbi:MAG TPA: AraC family transcriptional regulator [Ornithinibacter sp.]|mgnify:CR=1|nr:AraC family transcriptional regulator [Ornithinibacter sp.]HQD69247.1 AraC family transcriptional regulator [Ornithinibacter sp.]HQG17062.1 AraC family transcriptional regulator [Ornithinibacter sp.]
MTKPDTPLDDVERAHLVDPTDTTYAIDRFAPSPDVVDLVRRHWVPMWHLPEGESSEQAVLQYPVCLVVVAHDYARFYGVQSGLSRTTLVGTGWAAGVMLQPGAGRLLLGQDVSTVTDRHVELSDVLGSQVVTDVRAAMTDPQDPGCRREAADSLEAVIRAHLPLDDEGRLVNDLVDHIEHDPSVRQVSQVCDRFGLSERALQRLTRRRLGLTPKWLIQRRRLHEASERLRAGPGDLAAIAHDLGYADQAHFTRDFRRVTGITPGGFARRFAAGADA